MEAHRHLGRYRAAGALAGLAAALPVGYIALAEVAYVVAPGGHAGSGAPAWGGCGTGGMAGALAATSPGSRLRNPAEAARAALGATEVMTGTERASSLETIWPVEAGSPP